MKDVSKLVLACALMVGLVATAPCLALGETQNEADESQGVQQDASAADELSGVTPKMWCSSAKVDSIKLKWNGVSDATAYKLYRKTDGGTFKRIRTLPASARGYQDKKLSRKKTYLYKLRACKGSEASKYSQAVSKYKVRGNYKSPTAFGGYLSAKKLSRLANTSANVINKYQVRSLSKLKRITLLHDWICYVCSYSQKGNYFYSAYGCLVKKKASCFGYAEGMKALCKEAGVPCKVMRANKHSSVPNHEWNIVKLKGKWYIVDVQCDDTSGFYATFMLGSKSYKNITGMNWNTKKYPKVSSKDYDLS